MLKPVLGYTPKALEDTKALFVTKGIIYILAAILFWLIQPLLPGIAVYGLVGLMVISGLIMIATPMINEQANKSYQVACLIMGGMAIIVGALPLLWPAYFVPVIGHLAILALAIDTFFNMASFIYLSRIGAGIWWAIASGTVGFVAAFGAFSRMPVSKVAQTQLMVVQLLTQSLGEHLRLWLALYCLLSGLIFCTTPFLFSMVGKEKRTALTKKTAAVKKTAVKKAAAAKKTTMKKTAAVKKKVAARKK